MVLGKKISIALGLVLLLYVTGILVFTKGFLLKRIVIGKNSSCHASFAFESSTGTDSLKSDNAEGCWIPRRFKKAVIIIIDALRFDFARYNTSVGLSNALPFQNKLTVMHELLTKESHKTRLYKFVADPPTTTMQRLKGLTTGSLPTFVDAGANFASSEITEDNFIDQLRKGDRKITFMGDDTWVSLFPQRFNLFFAFPSFNVKDLHTVDNGVIEHLVPEIKHGNWDLLIGHFLGVDHCGHRFGPYHPAMAEKLTQMDKVLRSVVNSLDDDTILFVLGDHGMTRTGDHGGDSNDELDAALFVYSPTQITTTKQPQNTFQTVYQVDLVPTISLLLGIPIPFSNLGMVISDLFNYSPKWTISNRATEILHSIKAMRLNALQIKEYLTSYSSVSDEFPYIKYSELRQLLEKAEITFKNSLAEFSSKGADPDVLKRLRKVEKWYKTYLIDVKSMCHEIWAKFDVPSMTLGLTVTAGCLFVGSLLYTSTTSEKTLSSALYTTVTVIVLTFIYLMYILCMEMDYGSFVISLGFMVTIVVFVALIMIQLSRQGDPRPKSNPSPPDTVFSFVCAACYFLGFFSNSYIVNEDAMSSFLLQSLVWVVLFITCQKFSQGKIFISSKKTKSNQFDLVRLLTSPRTILMYLAVGFNVCIWLSSTFRACREEQWSCTISSFLQPLSSFTDENHYRNARYILAVMCVAIPAVVCRYWMKHYGNLNGSAPSVICASYLVPINSILISLHWALQGLPEKILDKLPVWQQVMLPRLVYFLTLLILTTLVYKPLCIYIMPKQDDATSFSSNTNQIAIPRVYNHIKLNWRKLLKSSKSYKNSLNGQEENPYSDSNPPVVYGLATVFSAAVLLLVTVVAQLLMMLLGDGLAPSLLLLLCSTFLFLELYACHKQESEDTSLAVPWPVVVVWGLMTSQFFYATGHQATVPTIRWDAAFNGLHGDFDNNILPGILIFLNTFASQVICTLTLPLLIVWPKVRGKLARSFSTTQKQEDGPIVPKGEFELNEDFKGFRLALFRLLLGSLLFHGIKLFGAMCAAGLLRRHLMVWKIFAPRFVFESASLLTLSILTMLVYGFVLRIDACLTKWVKTLEEGKS